MSKANWLPKKEPWLPAAYDDDVVYALRAVKEGRAMAHQQKLAWDWLMYVTGAGDGYADLSFRPGPAGERETVFAEGKRFVGLQMMKMLHPALTPKKPIGGTDEAEASTTSKKRGKK